jgi:hypothetical protein
MKWSIPVAAVLILSSCSKQDEKTYTVDELVNDSALLARIVAEYRNIPGEPHNAPNCLNAEVADGRIRLERMRKSLGG